MSGTNLLPSPGNGAATAPAAAGAAPAGGAPVGATSGGTAFDATLMLEELAAGATDVGINTGAAELGTKGAGAPESADPSTGDEDKIGLDNPLAFLAGLLAVVSHTHPHGGTGEAGAGEGDGGSADGADAITAAKHGDASASGIPFLTDGDAGTSATNMRPDDAAAAARALAAQTALATIDSKGTDDKAVATRAVDMLTQSSRPAPTPTDHPPIATHVRDPRWADDFSTRVALLVNQRESVAALSLTPLDLGPVDVSVTVRDSQATIHFGAAQAETRALIEASLPKLREMLAAQGFHLMDASVSHGFTRQSKSDAPSVPRPSSVDAVTPIETRAIAMNGLLDTYA